MPVARRADFRWFSEDDYLQLFRLQQLISEYLLYVQETLHRRNVTLESGVGAAQAQLQDQAEYIGVLEAQLRDRGGGANVGLQAVARCGLCKKAFATNAFLQAHIKRRHPGYSQPCAVSCSAAAPTTVPPPQPLPPSSAPQPQPMPPPSEPPVGAAVQPQRQAPPLPVVDDTTIRSAMAEVRQSVRDEIEQELPELRKSLEKELTSGLRDSLASSVKEQIEPVLAAWPQGAADNGAASGILSEQLQQSLQEQTGALRAQMDGLQEELKMHRAELEARMAQAAKDASVAGANAARESAMAGAATAGAANEAAQLAKAKALEAEEAARSATVIATEAARDAATHAAREAASKAAGEAAREAAHEAASQVAQLVAAEAAREALIEASQLAGSVARSEAAAVLAASQSTSSRPAGPIKTSLLGGELLDDDDDDTISLDGPKVSSKAAGKAPAPKATSSASQPTSKPNPAAPKDLGRSLTHEANELLEEVTLDHEVVKAFHAIDLDKSGTLTVGEVMRACREQEKVRLLLGLPRNLREDDGSLEAFRTTMAQLDADGSNSISLQEFVSYFTSPSRRAAAMAAAAKAPSWTSLVETHPLEVDGDPNVRTENAYLHWQSYARFEHSREKWRQERNDSLATLASELASWKIGGDQQTLSRSESDALISNQRAFLDGSSPFDAERRAKQRAKVEQVLKERVRLGHTKPTQEQMSAMKLASKLDAPIEVLATPLEPN